MKDPILPPNGQPRCTIIQTPRRNGKAAAFAKVAALIERGEVRIPEFTSWWDFAHYADADTSGTAPKPDPCPECHDAGWLVITRSDNTLSVQACDCGILKDDDVAREHALDHMREVAAALLGDHDADHFLPGAPAILRRLACALEGPPTGSAPTYTMGDADRLPDL